MEPTIYKPSIYKGAGIYKNGAAGGGNYKVIGGREYKTVVMPDGKEWLAENLDLEFCDFGIAYNVSIPAGWYYNNDKDLYSLDGVYKCGALYNRYAVIPLNKFRNIFCPGWHVPTKLEWDNLAIACGGASVAAKKLKAIDNSIISGFPSSFGGTDDYGFGALPGGQYFQNEFRFFGTDCNFHMLDGGNAYMTNGSDALQQDLMTDSRYGFFVRLVRD